MGTYPLVSDTPADRAGRLDTGPEESAIPVARDHEVNKRKLSFSVFEMQHRANFMADNRFLHGPSCFVVSLQIT